MRRLNSKFKSDKKAKELPPPPPSYYFHATDETETADAAAATQTSPQASAFGHTHMFYTSPDKADNNEDVPTYSDDHDIPVYSPAVEHHPATQFSPLSVVTDHQSSAAKHNTTTHPSTVSLVTHDQSEASSSVRALEIQSPVESLEERGGTVRYSFSPVGSSAMALLPPSGAHSSQPKYYIAVSLNCFMPLSHITTVYRGADERSPRVCDFEMGVISVANSRLRMEGYAPIAISSLLVKVRRPKENSRWVWKLPNDTSCFLLWDCSRVPFTCVAEFAQNIPTQLVARFTSHILPITSDYRQAAPPLSMLDILPAGRKCFDDILISLLILERNRLTPDVKTLFNY